MFENPLSPDSARPQFLLHQQACVDRLNRPIYTLSFAKIKKQCIHPSGSDHILWPGLFFAAQNQWNATRFLPVIIRLSAPY